MDCIRIQINTVMWKHLFWKWGCLKDLWKVRNNHFYAKYKLRTWSESAKEEYMYIQLWHVEIFIEIQHISKQVKLELLALNGYVLIILLFLVYDSSTILITNINRQYKESHITVAKWRGEDNSQCNYYTELNTAKILKGTLDMARSIWTRMYITNNRLLCIETLGIVRMYSERISV